MSYGHRFQIVSILLGVAVCAPIAALPTLSQPDVMASAAVASAPTSAPNSTAVSIPETAPEAAIEPETGRIMSCRSTDPVFCIYANRNLVSHLRQEAWATDVSIKPQQDSARNEEMTASRDRSVSTVNLGQKIRFLTQLKTWLDAIS